MEEQANQKVNFYSVFYDTLKNIPLSLGNQYVYYWNEDEKKYMCDEESKLIMLGLINSDDLTMAMEKIHNIDHLDPEDRFSKKISWFITFLVYVTAIYCLISWIELWMTSGNDVDIDYSAFFSLVLLGLSILLYCYCYINPEMHEKKMEERCKQLLDTLNELNSFFLKKNAFWKYGPCGAYITYFSHYSEDIRYNPNRLGLKLIPPDKPCLVKDADEKNPDLIDTVVGVLKGATGETKKITGNLVKMILTPAEAENIGPQILIRRSSIQKSRRKIRKKSKVENLKQVDEKDELDKSKKKSKRRRKLFFFRKKDKIQKINKEVSLDLKNKPSEAKEGDPKVKSKKKSKIELNAFELIARLAGHIKGEEFSKKFRSMQSFDVDRSQMLGVDKENDGEIKVTSMIQVGHGGSWEEQESGNRTGGRPTYESNMQESGFDSSSNVSELSAEDHLSEQPE